MLVNGEDASPCNVDSANRRWPTTVQTPEGALRAGGYLPNGWQLAPGPAQSWTNTGIFRGGNYSRSYWPKSSARCASKSPSGQAYGVFVVRPGTSNPLQPGVWQRVGGVLRWSLRLSSNLTIRSVLLAWRGAACWWGCVCWWSHKAIDDILSKTFSR